ncbi:hypothetical protein HN748_03135, partial [Candidatus Peregrinibacteria bacterium]|nr:hypothetical protein [Candidatus Peregrinibacteria bacterium]
MSLEPPGLAPSLPPPLSELDRETLILLFKSQVFRPESPREQLEVLGQGQWYPLGLPPLQMEVEDPFFKTQDGIRLMEELGRRRAAGESVYAVVANSKVNIENELARRYPEMSEYEREAMAEEKRRLIGIKDQLFWAAVQVFNADEARLKGEDMDVVPVFMMSDFESEEGFDVLHQDVLNLFNFEQNSEFVEAVYECVPRNKRPRKHKNKNYEGLVTLGNENHLRAMNAACRYVLYQIAMVLFTGGVKLGHKDEKPYDEATKMAQNLLGSHPFAKELEFEEVEVPEATGANPYRAGIGMKAARRPDSFTSYASLEAYMKDHVPQLEALGERLIEFNEAQTAINFELVEFMGSGVQDLSTLEGFQARIDRNVEAFQTELLESFQSLSADQDAAVAEEERRIIKFRHILQVLIDINKDLNDTDRERVRDAFLDQDVRGSILTLDQPPKYWQSFLLRRTGLAEALSGDIPVEELETRVSEWIPFECQACPGMKDYAFLMKVAMPLVEFDEVGKGVARWTANRHEFEEAIFSDWIINPPMDTLSSRVTVIFGVTFGLFDKI